MPASGIQFHSTKKFILEGGKIMPYAKKIREQEKKFYRAGEKIERLGAKLSAACLFYDLTPGGEHDMEENFADFIQLLVYCNEKKLYSVRDNALKKILHMIIE